MSPVSHEFGVAAPWLVCEVMAEARRRVRAAADRALAAGDAEVAGKLVEMVDDLDEARPGVDLDGPDWALPCTLAALMGVTLGERPRERA